MNRRLYVMIFIDCRFFTPLLFIVYFTSVTAWRENAAPGRRAGPTALAFITRLFGRCARRECLSRDILRDRSLMHFFRSVHTLSLCANSDATVIMPDA